MRSSFKSCESVPAKLPSGFINKSPGIFEGCTLSTTTRPWEVRANAAAYFSATRELGEKSVGNRMFRNGYIPIFALCFVLWSLDLDFGLWTLRVSCETTKYKAQRTKHKDRFPLSLLRSSMPNSAGIPSAHGG